MKQLSSRPARNIVTTLTAFALMGMALTATAQGAGGFADRLVHVDTNRLSPRAPGNAGVFDPIRRGPQVADAIVGWYDRGHNYHAQHMNSRVWRPDLGQIRTIPGRDLTRPVRP